MHHQIIASLLGLTLVVGCSDGHSNMDDLDTEANCETGYTEQASSLYNLPYAKGEAYTVGQGNCTDGSHLTGSEQAYAYDFDMPIGTDIVAAREGSVEVVVEQFTDGNNIAGRENYIIIQHGDGSISGYYHLTFEGALVEVGDFVEQGDVIGKSGNTGNSSAPHLHFEVAQCQDCQTLPTNFKNTRSHTHGLEEGEAYIAE